MPLCVAAAPGTGIGGAGGGLRCRIALSPGAGKTLVGLEVIRRRGDRALVFGPNTAIQAQWCGASEAYQRGGAAIDRELLALVTVLTYQALATFDPDATAAASAEDASTGSAASGPALVDQLHPNGQALLEELQHAGPLTIVLDECHHVDPGGRPRG